MEKAPAPTDITPEKLAKFFGRAEARDKFGRMFQFGARMFMGILANPTDAAGKERLAKVTALHNMLRDSRHTLRWMKWMNFVAPIRDAKEVGLELMSKIALGLFFFFDNIRWLQKLKLVPGENKFHTWHPIHGNGKFALSWLAIGSFLGALAALQKLMALSGKPEDEAVAKARWASQKAAFKGLLMTYQGLHLSQLYVHENTWVGLAGVISSAMDTKAQYALANPGK